VPTLGLDAPDTDVIMVDIRLLSPEVSALLDAAKSRDPAVRTVLLAPIGLIAAPPRGFDAVLSKPVRRRPLLQCIERLRGVASPEIERTVTAADTRRVLLVDDNAVNRRVAEHQLRKYDCIVTSACDGVAGVAAAMSDDYDLILMDCQMPLLDGFDATRQIRIREQPGMRVPIIALTANAMAGDRELCLTAGMDDYLAKPLDPVALATCIDRWAPRSRSALRASAPLLVTIAEPASQASPITPPIDLAALAVVTDGEADFERELMAVFVASGDATLAAIVDAVNSGDLSAVKRHAHTLKGASANLRALPLAECAQALENAAAQGDLQRCRGVLGDVQSDYRRTTEFISAHGT
jgi:two-component system, sensor histidine kinase and response regulator